MAYQEKEESTEIRISSAKRIHKRKLVVGAEFALANKAPTVSRD